ncbi:hypothetical protein AGMMS49579_23990 [Spirochaetia bacterium]|nr:hypothetical protein AGMMS49579_23990 [Spirochaetia bacterium]
MIKTDPLTAKTGFGIVDQDLETRLVKGGGTAFRGRTYVPIGNEDYFFRPGRREGVGIFFRIGKGSGNIRPGFQGVHQQHTADDGFYLTLAFDTASNFHLGLIGKRNKMKGIADTQKFP